MTLGAPQRHHRPKRRALLTAALVAAFALVAAGTADAKHPAAKPHPLKIPDSGFDLLQWKEIAGWVEDDHAEALGAFLTSCRAITKSPAKTRAQQPVLDALHAVCTRALTSLPLDEAGARAFFEKNFRPVRLATLGESEGFFTGYYEPVVEGSREKTDVYNVPLYRKPGDFLIKSLRFSKKTGKGKFRKRAAKKTGPYYDRAAIEDGVLNGRGLEICYLKDPIDAFFAQIQGSLRVRLDDGSMIRLNYDAQNGHAYTPVGRFLVERKIFTREEISMQKIREWMQANPEEAKALRRENKSYVFFREMPLGPQDEPPGAQGVSLTAGRSIAVDRKLHTYGMPVFIDALLPIASEKADTPFRRLMVAQDTGGAIVGPARADIYLGAGDEAARAAGRFKHPGHFVMLVPASLAPGKLDAPVPLPLPRPKTQTAQEGAKAPAPESSAPQTAPKTAPKLAEQSAKPTGEKGNAVSAVGSAPQAVVLPKAKQKPSQ